jgi:hypothetical protein
MVDASVGGKMELTGNLKPNRVINVPMGIN